MIGHLMPIQNHRRLCRRRLAWLFTPFTDRLRVANDLEMKQVKVSQVTGGFEVFQALVHETGDDFSDLIDYPGGLLGK
jgi:hypothetical protein